MTNKNSLMDQLHTSIHDFVAWLDRFGETSHDHQSYFAGPLGGKSKALYYRKPLLGTIAVAPMIFSEAFLPSARRLFWKKQRLPIADAHYAMGFAFLSRALNSKEYHEKAVHFLNVLERTRSKNYQHYCWGYPFDWQTRNGMISAGTPLITTTPYAYEAFQEVYLIDRNERWPTIMRSIAKHVAQDIRDFEVSPNASTCSYTPHDNGGVINASAYRSFMLTDASIQFSENGYRRIAERNLNFVIENQQRNGSWHYAIDGVRNFVDHFHTCFILKALAKIEKLTGHNGCDEAIERGIRYYLVNLLDEKGLPKPFAKAPRLTVYKSELYDYAECINLCVLLRSRFTELDRVLSTVLDDLLSRWKKPDGSFRSRKLFIGWDNVPMHRWAQSQIFRSLCLLLCEEKKNQ